MARITLAGGTIHSAECEHPVFMVGSGLLVEADTAFRNRSAPDLVATG